MHVLVAGAHGRTARLLHPLLLARGHAVRGLVRDPRQSAALQALGVEPVVVDLDAGDGIDGAAAGCEAVVCAAGAGPDDHRLERHAMDRDCVLRLIAAVRRTGIRRFVLVGALGADRHGHGHGVAAAYLRARAEADAALRASGLDYTILRAGPLTDTPAVGRIALSAQLPRAPLGRADLAATLAETLDRPETVCRQWDVTFGGLAIKAAIGEATRSHWAFSSPRH
ncbi:SDR family oxidoreductase [Coralloluteibacterium stylophorae]|uniref:SDR family oxidoreductase n=1 Tax=Coralloluteibacterium stylophorae TaxID=1776034 RepID=A0A8J7VSW7_9GAMM|nr:SDR family oxidoreductase [Coralloluteibacterium stylophorae]MBS7457063.1 SDR family oxidoreductase [Coralloluteibacterium stylophorae]